MADETVVVRTTRPRTGKTSGWVLPTVGEPPVGVVDATAASDPTVSNGGRRVTPAAGRAGDTPLEGGAG